MGRRQSRLSRWGQTCARLEAEDQAIAFLSGKPPQPAAAIAANAAKRLLRRWDIERAHLISLGDRRKVLINTPQESERCWVQMDKLAAKAPSSDREAEDSLIALLLELPQDALRLIRALVEARLLTTRDELVEVAHEALFKAWPTLDVWLSEEHTFLTDLERIRDAHHIWAQAPPDQKSGALLHGLLLSRARDWLIKYPQRFLGSGIEPMRAFIAASAAAEDARSARARSVRRRLFQATAAAAIIFAAVAAVAGWQYFAAEQARQRAERNFGIAKNAADHVVFRIAQDLRNVQGMRVESVRQILDAAQAMMDELARAAPDDLPLQRSRAAMLNQFVTTYLGAGDLTRARAAAEESLAIRRKLAAADPGNAGWQRDVSVSLDQVGDVRRAAGDRAGALAAYEESLAIRRKLAAADPGNAGWQADLVDSLYRVSTAAEPPRARAALREALVIAEALAREGKLTAAQQNWPQLLRDALAKLPPEEADAR
jgi:tetratricopeptide (TPR) repeat protein